MNRPREPIQTGIKTGRIKEAMARYCMGRDMTRKVAADAGALIKVGKICLYDFQIMDEYIDKHRIEPTDDEIRQARLIYGDD